MSIHPLPFPAPQNDLNTSKGRLDRVRPQEVLDAGDHHDSWKAGHLLHEVVESLSVAKKEVFMLTLTLELQQRPARCLTWLCS